MRQSSARWVLLALALLVCAHTAEAQKKSRGDRNKITRVDLDEAGGTVISALDAINLLRPMWLNPPMGRSASSSLGGSQSAGGTTATEPIVYIDDMRQTAVDVLRSLKASTIVEMKYLDQNRAIQMLGPGHEMGAIQVTTIHKKP